MGQEATKRLFIAVEVDDVASESLLQSVLKQCSHADGVLYEKSKLHLTLRFLGQTQTDDISSLVNVLSPVFTAMAPFPLTLKQLTHFGGKKKHVLVALSALPLPLALLYRELNTALLRCGVNKEVRAFRPHVTVSRRAAGVLVLQSALDISFSVQRVILYDSVTTSEGSVYQEVATFPLAG